MFTSSKLYSISLLQATSISKLWSPEKELNRFSVSSSESELSESDFIYWLIDYRYFFVKSV